MSKLIHWSKKEQEEQVLFGGSFIENKPISFPSYFKKYAYSNLFYWAHLEAKESNIFPLHPQGGFEIMTFVLKGRVEHYDTINAKYIALKQGDMQIMQTGSGMQHSEKILKGSELFQLWFNPDFKLSLKNKAQYKDYSQADFVQDQKEGIKSIQYLGDESTNYHETQGISIKKQIFEKGKYFLALDKDTIYSIYILNASGTINEQEVIKDDFIKIEESQELKILAKEALELFIVSSPSKISYPLI